MSLCFDDPQAMWNNLMDGKVQIKGNIEFANKIKKIIRKECLDSLDLYESQDYIRDYCVQTYGELFYNKNAEAITFLVENEYCNLERQRNPYYNEKSEDMDIDSITMF